MSQLINHFKQKGLQPWIPHFIGIFLIVAYPILAFTQFDLKATGWRYGFYFQILLMALAFYLNYLVFVPRYLLTKRKIHFFMVLLVFSLFILILSQVGTGFINRFTNDILPIRGNPPHYADNARPAALFNIHPQIITESFLLILTLGFSTSLRVIRQTRENESQRKDLEKKQTETELAFLKKQINPHFFFNSLNTIYALITIDGNEAQKAVETLSDMMRYLIYESDTKSVRYEKELGFIRNYIDLMKKRLSSKVDINLTIPEDLPDFFIPPLIFIPFIENAFKHGISYSVPSFINISFTGKNQQIIFRCENSVSKIKQKNRHHEGGFGILNLKKRLTLLYGEQAFLQQTENENIYQVQLTIPIQ